MPKDNQTKLSDVARQANTDKAKRFSSTMIPAPPLPKQPPVAETIAPDPVPTIVDQPASESLPEKPGRAEVDFGEGRGETLTVDEPKEKVAAPKPTPVDKSAPKTARARRSGALTIDEVINGEPPKGEPYPRQVRISEQHHKLLRKLAFLHDKTQNHILFNLLDLLEQADQREQQKGE